VLAGRGQHDRGGGAPPVRVPAAFEPVLADAVAVAGGSGASLYVYGSVATGTVRPGSSDVDLLSIDLLDAAGNAVCSARTSVVRPRTGPARVV
jgi:hypothetical protein